MRESFVSWLKTNHNLTPRRIKKDIHYLKAWNDYCLEVHGLRKLTWTDQTPDTEIV